MLAPLDLPCLCFTRFFEHLRKQLAVNQEPVPFHVTMSFFYFLSIVDKHCSLKKKKNSNLRLPILLLWTLGTMFIFILALHIFGKPGKSACLLLIGNCGLPVLVLGIKPSFYLSVEKIQSSPNLYLKAYTFKDKEIVKGVIPTAFLEAGLQGYNSHLT